MRILFILIAALVVLLPSADSMAECGNVKWSWAQSCRSNIVVKICYSAFDDAFEMETEYSRTAILSIVKESISLYNSYLGADFKYNLGDANGVIEASGAGCIIDNAEAIPSCQLWFTAGDIGPQQKGGLDYVKSNGVMTSAQVILYNHASQEDKDFCSGFCFNDINNQRYYLPHELGHIIFRGGDGSGCPQNTVVDAIGDGEQTIWNNDISAIIAPCPTCGQGGYSRSPAKLIKHKVSTNDGSTWTREYDNLNEYTRLPVGVAYKPDTTNPYTIAWVADDESHEIWTAVGTGTSWTAKQTIWWTTDTGVSMAYGNGHFLLAWAAQDSTYVRYRLIFWSSSTDGINWSFPMSISYTPFVSQNNPNSPFSDYARSFTGPSVVFDPSSNHFLLAYDNAYSTTSYVRESLPVICVTEDPTEPFESCSFKDNDRFTTNTPTIICPGMTDGNCALIQSEKGVQNSRLINVCGTVNQSGLHRWEQSTIAMQSSSYASTSELSSAASTTGTMILAFRGQNNSGSGNIASKTITCNAFSSKSTWSDTFSFGPTVVYGNNKFSIFYGN